MKKLNAIMIDASRVLERHEYYYRLIDFMSQWKMNALLFHFSDDHGLAVQLPGFKDLASPHAFTVAQAEKLVAYAKQRGVELIPELETFGHTYFLTETRKYRHLRASGADRKVGINALDPISPETRKLIFKLMKATCEIFPGKYLHVGCDEVDIKGFCEKRGLDTNATWANYVNVIFAHCRKLGRTPMFWADHPINDPAIAKLLDKNAAAVFWNYETDVTDKGPKFLKASGFRQVFVAPGISSFRRRFLPAALENVDILSAAARKHNLNGVITTIWCPYRHLQGSMYYGVAYSARTTAAGGKINLQKFNAEFARKVFAVKGDATMQKFLSGWPRLDIPGWFCTNWLRDSKKLSSKEHKHIVAVERLASRIMPLAERLRPAANADIFNAMKLAGWCVWACGKTYVLSMQRSGQADRRQLKNQIAALQKQLRREWDRTRFADDPRRRPDKRFAPPAEHADGILSLLVKKLK